VRGRVDDGAVAAQAARPSTLWIAPLTDQSWYADEARGFLRALERPGRVTHSWRPNFEPVIDGPTVVWLPWEYGAPPAEWVEEVTARVDRVWAPSAYVRDGYVAAGMPPNIAEVVPDGVDTERYTPGGPRFGLPRSAACVFLFVGGTIWRKGVDILPAAWQEAFGPGDDVLLVVKDFGAATHYRGQTDQQRSGGSPRAGTSLRSSTSRTSSAGRAAVPLPRGRRPRRAVPRRGVLPPGARGDELRGAGDPHRRRAHGQVRPARRGMGVALASRRAPHGARASAPRGPRLGAPGRPPP
jgi:hypothetical protein